MSSQLSDPSMERFHASFRRHFVTITYDLRRGEHIQHDHMSCFVIECQEVWFLITAGHVINHLRALEADRWRRERTALADFFANPGVKNFPQPFSFELEEWWSHDEDGIDCAAFRLDAFRARSMESVGVKAIGVEAAGIAEFEEGRQLALVGVPAESLQANGDDLAMRIVMMPLQEYQGSALESLGTSLRAQLLPNPGEAEHAVDDVRGMSGCPVFSVDTTRLVYRAVGLQSSWYRPERSVRISQIAVLFDLLSEALDAMRETPT